MLQPGDVLLWRVVPQAPWKDRLIGWGENLIHQVASDGYEYYHVAFVSNDTNQMYSSQPPKIDLYPIPKPLPDYVEVYRTITPLDHVQLINIFKYAESRRGRPYPFIGVLTIGWLSGNLEFCSQYTEDSFACGQVVLSDDIRFTTPDDIANSSLIKRVLDV
jgi:hypothetical protein